MRDQAKTKAQLISELEDMRGRFAELEVMEAERKQAEEMWRQSEADWQELLENAIDLVQSMTPDGRFLYVNSAWRDTLGYSQDEVAGHGSVKISV